MSRKSLFAKIARFLGSLSKVRLDEESWLEVFGPEERLYCEKDRKLLVHMNATGKKSLVVSIPKNWGTTSIGDPATKEDLDRVGAKLKRYYESNGYCCVVEYFDPWKR
jgi:hypothetical protein